MSIPYGEKYELLKLSDDLDRERLRQHIGVGRPGARVFDVVTGSRCESVILENDYIDVDYRACHADQYYLSHYVPPNRCKRLHFFSCPIGPTDMLDLSKHSDHYQGFTTLRPFSHFHLGRTILSESVLGSISPIDQKPFLTCNAAYHCNIAGSDMEVIGSPWMQQDNLVAACASVSLWSATYHMSHRFAPEFRVYNTANITTFATKNDVAGTKQSQSPGLTTSQMMFALREMGYEPVIYTNETVGDKHGATSILYHYIESGVPVILSFGSSRGYHAIVCVGHTLPKSGDGLLSKAPAALCEGEGFSIQPTSRRIRSFIVNDDADGPFRFMTFEDAPAQSDSYTRGIICGMRFEGSTEKARLHSMIVPLPKGVVIRSDTAETQAMNLISQHQDLVSGQELVVRTFLSLSNAYKAYWLKQGCPVSLAAIARSEVFSRWVWITEVSTPELFYTRHRVLAHIIQDPAAYAENDAYLLAIVNGAVFIRRNSVMLNIEHLRVTTLLPRMGRPWNLEESDEDKSVVTA